MLQAIGYVYELVRLFACAALCLLAFFALGHVSDWVGRQTGRPISHGLCVLLALALGFWLVYMR